MEINLLMFYHREPSGDVCNDILHVGLGTGHAYKLTNIRYELDLMTFRPIEYCAPPNYKSSYL